MESDPKKKKEEELERRLRTPKSVISREKFTDADTQETELLIKTYLSGKFYLDEPMTQSQNQQAYEQEIREIYHREQALTEIKDILKEWIVHIAKTAGGMDEVLAQDQEAKIFPFGSHRLGVNSRGGDIDILVLCPNYVDREVHFFENLYDRLSGNPHVKQLIKVNDPKVLVPIITMKFHDIDIDLAFAKLDVSKLNKNLKNLNDNELLITLEEKMVFGFNGPRNVDMIIQSVDPKEDPQKISNFRTTLKLLKLWAKNKCIYSNAMGYVTGISLAILVAKICQLFPNLKPNKLIQKFFLYYSIWNWDKFPVKIEEIKTYENLEKFNKVQWFDPTDAGEGEKVGGQRMKEEPMMVITPAFPVMNATRKVTKNNLEIMKACLVEGNEIVKEKPVNWQKLFSKVDFFGQYNNFIEVTVLANDDSEFHKWSGLIDSQMIVLTTNLERDIKMSGRALHLYPYPVAFEKFDPDFQHAEAYYYGLKFQKSATNGQNKPFENDCDLRNAVFEFISRQWVKKMEGKFQTGNIKIVQLVRSELPQSTLEQAYGLERTVPQSDLSKLGKRPIEKMGDSEYEPGIVKKMVLNPREDAETKSMSSPLEENENNGHYGSRWNQENVVEPQNAPQTTFQKEVIDVPKKPQPQPPMQQPVGNGKPTVVIPPKIPLEVAGNVGKTDFVDLSSMMNQSDELDNLF